MTYFIYDGKITINAQFQFKGEEVNHILKSRRIRKRETINVQDNTSERYEVVIDQIIRKKILATAVCQLDIPPESKLKIQVFQAAIKEKAADNIIQKLTELGCWKLTIFQSEYSQKLPQGDQLQKKINRWQKISIEACKQCNRLYPLQVEILASLSDVLTYIQHNTSDLTSTFFLDSEKTLPTDLKSLGNQSQVNLIVGSEGGWHPKEKELNAFNILQLGPRILRADTAAISVTAVFQHLLGDLN
jgi:16S rRNA (uracil1498-N3)-methyltransferase